MTEELAGRRQRQAGILQPTDSAALQVNEVVMMLELAGSLHTAVGDPQVWHDVLISYRECHKCQGVLYQLPEPAMLTPDTLAALAGQLSHCATYSDDCGHGVDFKRQRCIAFAVHMHAAAASVHKAHKARLFEHMLATWLVDRDAQVYEANAAAKDLVRAGERVIQVGSRLELFGEGGARALRTALAKVNTTARLAWKDATGKDVSFLLRALPATNHVTVTALVDTPNAKDWAPLLAKQLGLTPRQSQLAAHLLGDLTLTDAARAMGISRHTANEHLAALQQRTGAVYRKALLVLLRRVATHFH